MLCCLRGLCASCMQLNRDASYPLPALTSLSIRPFFLPLLLHHPAPAGVPLKQRHDALLHGPALLADMPRRDGM